MLNITGIYKWLPVLVITVLVMACASEKTMTTEQQSVIVWPSPPAQARVSYVRSFSKPADLGIGRGFFQWLSDVFTGEETVGLIRPMSVVVTANGQIYVADPGAKGVHRFDLKQGAYKLIARADDKILPSPVALSLGADNSVYVADSELAQIFQITASAESAQQIMPGLVLQQPTGIAFDPATKRLYITETAGHQIKVINSDGSVHKTFGQRGDGKGEFNFPTYICLDGKGRLLVTDSLNFRIQIFDKAGQFISTFGRLGDGTGNLSRPKGMAIDQYGHIYVVDALFNNVQIFNEQGKLLLIIGSQGNKPGEFWLPAGIFLNNNDDIYIADSHNQRIQILRYIGARR